MIENTQAEAIPADFVYAGRRVLADNRLGAAIHRLTEAGRLGKEDVYDAKAFKGFVLGGVYRGATFRGDTIVGAGAAKYVERWASESDRIHWLTLDEAAESEMRAAKLIKDAKKVHEIEAIMLPLRKLYAGYNSRRDSAGKEALEEAVLRALRSEPRGKE